MENTHLLPSIKILELDDDINQSSNISINQKFKNWCQEHCQCVSRKKIVHAVICISSCIIFVGLLSFIYLGKFITL